MTEITTKAELIDTLRESKRRVIAWFTAIPVQDFFTRQGESWSASDNLDHLIRAHQPIAQALKLPRVAFRVLFGKPQKASRTYEELCQAYREKLAQGARAGGQFLPSQENFDSKAEAKKSVILNRFAKASTELVAAAETWEAASLDRYLLPHPILGKLTIREMLFFTIYHNLRHASQAGD